MDDKIIVGCKCNPKCRMSINEHELNYIHRLLVISGFDMVDLKHGMKIYECHQAVHIIDNSLAYGRIMEPRNSRKPLPYLVSDNSDNHFNPISNQSKVLIERFMNVMKRSLGVKIH